MSKSTVKKLLQSMTKEEVIEVMLELYSARKEAQEYLDFYAEPDEKSKLEEYKAIICEEFYPKNDRRTPKVRFSVCRKAVSDFKKLQPSAEAIAELLVSYMEWATHFTCDYGDMWEQYYDSVAKNFGKTLKHLLANDLWNQYENRLQKCVEWSSRNGYGFADAIKKLYYEGCAMNHDLLTKFPMAMPSTAELKKLFNGSIFKYY